MANTIEIIGNSLVITDDLNNVILDKPKDRIYYSSEKLKNGFIALYKVEEENEFLNFVYNTPINENQNSSLVTFTKELFETFARDNLGFKTASGGSGAVLENLTATGAIDIDVKKYSRGSIKLNLTGNTTLTFSNFPTTSTTLTLIITTSTGSETLTLPSALNYHYYGELDLTSRNKIALEFSTFSTNGLEVDVFQNVKNT